MMLPKNIYFLDMQYLLFGIDWLLGGLLLFETDFYLILFSVNSPEVARSSHP